MSLPAILLVFTHPCIYDISYWIYLLENNTNLKRICNSFFLEGSGYFSKFWAIYIYITGEPKFFFPECVLIIIQVVNPPAPGELIESSFKVSFVL